MNIVGKTFISNTDGSSLVVESMVDNIAHLESGQRIAIERLVDTSYYTPQVDPADFFNSSPVLENLASTLVDKIRSTPDSYFDDRNAGVTQIRVDGAIENRVNPNTPANNNFYNNVPDEPVSTIISDDEYDRLERERLMAKIREMGGNNIQTHNIDDVLPTDEQKTEIRIDNVDMGDNAQYIKPQQDPATAMFRGLKRSVKFDVSVKIEELIPRKDFLSMWEDSYETSILDYLANEFTQKLLSDPSVIRQQIRNKLQEVVYDDKPKAARKPRVRKSISVTEAKPVQKRVKKND